MIDPIAFFAVILYTALFLLATVWLIWRMWKKRGRHTPLPYEPIEDPFKPDPIVKTRGVRATGSLGVTWSVLHVVGLILWVMFVPPPQPAGGVPSTSGYAAGATALGVYVVTAAVLTSVGSILLLRCVASGRKLLSWSQFLFAMGGFLGAILMLLLTQSDKTPSDLRGAAPYFSAILVLYTALAVGLGAAAQRVGVPSDLKRARERGEQEPPAIDTFGYTDPANPPAEGIDSDRPLG